MRASQDLVNLSLNQPQRISVNPFNSIVSGLTQAPRPRERDRERARSHEHQFLVVFSPQEFIRVRQSKDVQREAIVLALCKRTFTKKV